MEKSKQYLIYGLFFAFALAYFGIHIIVALMTGSW